MINHLLREPLLHFFLIGSALFGAYAWTDGGPGGKQPTADEIVVDDTRIAELEAQFSRLWQRPPARGELQALVDDWVREEILYREGLTMGLERNDPIIRKRVAQKLAFISEDLMTSAPSEAQLSEWFTAHRDDYRQETMLTVQQILIDDGTDAARAQAAAAEVRDALAHGSEPSALGAATLLPHELPGAATGDIARTFGDTFAAELLDMPLGEWLGPVSSAYGAHLVRITAREPGRLLGLAEVRTEVQRDLVRARLEEANEAFMDQLRSRYVITVVSELADRRETSTNGGDRS